MIMNREIKFRGFSIYAKKWVYGYLVQDKNKENSLIVYRQGNTESFNDAVITESVGQYTGLKDKNGVDIFEGDILKYSDGGDVSHHRIYWDVKTAKYYDERLEDGDSNSVYYGFEFVESCIVIGNIYENPELLK